MSQQNKMKHIEHGNIYNDMCLPAYSFVDIDIIMPACTAVFDTFQPISCDVWSNINP